MGNMCGMCGGEQMSEETVREFIGQCIGVFGGQNEGWWGDGAGRGVGSRSSKVWGQVLAEGILDGEVGKGNTVVGAIDVGK